MTYRFTTPQVMMTPGAMNLLAHFGTNPMELVKRHFSGYWGGQPDNAERNEEYLADGEGMLMSVFEVGPEKLWAISHIGYGSDSYTTLLLPEEY
jgi:hypothetical protein